MSRVDPKLLENLQSRPSNVRNFCILAHVDHGKTTLSDSLVSSNGLISERLAGQMRYLDSTEEEQKRGITMHSSAISLLYTMESKNTSNDSEIKNNSHNVTPSSENYLINLVDSPGHIDFSSDVSTATRLSDGALIVVDVVEGVCTQTHAVLFKALRERMIPCLVLNKMDRLILELCLSPVEAFRHLQRIIEHVNAISYQLVASELTSDKTKKTSKTHKTNCVCDCNWESIVFLSIGVSSDSLMDIILDMNMTTGADGELSQLFTANTASFTSSFTSVVVVSILSSLVPLSHSLW